MHSILIQYLTLCTTNKKIVPVNFMFYFSFLQALSGRGFFTFSSDGDHEIACRYLSRFILRYRRDRFGRTRTKVPLYFFFTCLFDIYFVSLLFILLFILLFVLLYYTIYFITYYIIILFFTLFFTMFFILFFTSFFIIFFTLLFI